MFGLQRSDVMSFFWGRFPMGGSACAGAAGPLGCRLVRWPLVLVCTVCCLLLEIKDPRAYEWEMRGLGLKPRRRTGGAVLGAWLETRWQQGTMNSNVRGLR